MTEATALPRVLVATLIREEGDTGVQAHVTTFRDQLRQQGRDVEVVTPYGPDAWFFLPLYALRLPLRWLNADLAIWWYRATRLLALRWRLGRRLRGGGAGLVYAQCPVSAQAGLMARAQSGQAVVMVVHFNLSQADEFAGQGAIREGGRVWRGIREFEARVLPQLDGVVFVSRFMRQQLLQRVQALAAVPHQEIPNFAFPPEVTPSLRRTARRRLVAVGTLEPRKNQSYLLHLFKAASARLPGLELTLVGDGPDRRALEALAAELGVASQVRFLGQVSRAAKLLPQFDACVHVARLENLPIVLIEAMSCGLPVLACAVGGIPEMFDDGCEGRYLPLEDAARAGAIVADTLRDADAADRMAAAAHLRFQRDFETTPVVRRLQDFLDQRHSAALQACAPGPGMPSGRRRHRRLPRTLLGQTSLPTQLLHSGTSFLMMAGMARFAPSEAFAVAALFFLLVTLVSSLNVYVLSAAWLRTEVRANASPLASLILLLCAGLAIAFGLAWAFYRRWAFGPADALEGLAAPLAAFSYLYFFAWRRQRLLEARYLPVTLADTLRALVIFGGGGLLYRFGIDLGFVPFLAVFIAAHGLGALAMPGPQASKGSRGGRWWLRSTRPLRAIRPGDWLGVISGLTNVVFSQAASLLAPMLIGPINYASLRAYELFLFPVFFIAQVLDPLYMARYRHGTTVRDDAIRFAQIVQPALLMFLPVASIGLVVWTVPAAKELFLLMIAPAYRRDFGLLALVLCLSGWISLNAPIRWRLTVAGAGSPLLKGTVVGIVVSLIALAALTRWQASPAAVLWARMVYEACLAGAGIAGMWSLGRARRAAALRSGPRRGVWFLGQPTPTSVVDVAGHLRRLAEALQADHPAAARLIYRPHPDEGPEGLALARQAGFEIEERPGGVEALWSLELPEAVYSSDCTELMKCRACLPDDIPLVAFAPWLLRPPGERPVEPEGAEGPSHRRPSRPSPGSALRALEDLGEACSGSVPNTSAPHEPN